MTAYCFPQICGREIPLRYFTGIWVAGGGHEVSESTNNQAAFRGLPLIRAVCYLDFELSNARKGSKVVVRCLRVLYRSMEIRVRGYDAIRGFDLI